ncbi:MAG: diguanylate cyclase [Nitrospirae bacterium]|nr:diguanylate cyclase [Nitrospirota bacterium]
MEPSYKILIVDDDFEIRGLLETFLTSEGHLCETASRGNEALQKTLKTQYDAVVTDIKMPDMDGITLTTEILKEHPEMPIMAMTGFSVEYSEKETIDAGASDFITKPFTLTEFSARLRKMMRDHALRRIDTGVEKRIESLKNEIDLLKDLAYYDPLTGLPNRKLFLERLTQTLESAKRYHNIAAILYCDLDDFKQINDTFGHEAGDLLLKEVTRRLSASVRGADTAARMGGDEFTVILVRITKAEEAANVARRILDALSASFLLEGSEYSISASIGISIYPSDSTDAENLIRFADTAMYEAKQQGKNRCRFYQDLQNESK